MIITDTSTVNQALTSILAKESMITIDMKDIKQLFGDNSSLRMMKIAGDSVDDVIIKLKADLTEIGGCPEKYFAAYVSMSLRMSDLETLSEVTNSANKYKHTLIYETYPEGKIVVYYFF